MGEQKPEKVKKHICTGLLAHVDAGKTTLSEDILYHTGVIRSLGRVDHRDTFLDTDARERKRGITIFSKEVHFDLDGKSFTLMDTPGHTDFSAEMERVLSVLDYAVLIISASDGVQSHTRTLWRLINRYELPVFIFVNKMDMEGTDREAILDELRRELSGACVDMSSVDLLEDEERLEELSLCDDRIMEAYLEKGSVDDELISRAVAERRLIPCVFGSALKDQGTDRLLKLLSAYAEPKAYPEAFSAIVYKISRDEKGARYSHVKIMGGSLRVKDSIELPVMAIDASGMSIDRRNASQSQDAERGTVSEKVERIRLYNGDKAMDIAEAGAGMVVAISGPKNTYAGMVIGRGPVQKPLLEPLFEYAIIPPFDVDRKQLYLRLKALEEEIPELLLSYIPQNDEIHVRLMGDVQNEIIKDLIAERYGVEVELTEGSIIYKETIASSVEGVGHFEPLRHYAEVHLLMEPGERGSGIEAVDLMGEGKGLSGNYRRLILSHILEKEHIGVLTGSALTDVRISLVSGRSHDKHTEGGDFREATYRAIRQGLMYAENVLLEPYYEYSLSLPGEYVGRAINDIQRMGGSFETETGADGETVLHGRAPVSQLRNYNSELMSYTKGLGRLSLEFCGYDICQHAEEAQSALGYEPELDVSEPVGSVFCSHGAGYYVNWDQVYGMMHLPFATDIMKEKKGAGSDIKVDSERYIQSEPFQDAEHEAHGAAAKKGQRAEGGAGAASKGNFDYLSQGYEKDRELMSIFRKTFGLTKSERNAEREDDQGLFKSARRKGAKDGRGEKLDQRMVSAPDFVRIKDRKKSYLLVDGYNIIFAWDELRELAELNLDSARLLLMDILSNYQGYKGMNLILVFDAYRVKGGQRKIERYHNIYVVYTEEAETADKYIEKTVHDMDRKHDVTVATSDGLEQIIVFGEGAIRLSARELYEEVMKASEDMRREFLEKRTKLWNTVIKDS